MTKAALTGIVLCLAVTVPTATQADTSRQCAQKKIEAERLPDLNIPRSGHSIFFVNGEPTVVGGHTSGFTLTPTAEYLSNGEWHLMQTVFTHDYGTAVPLDSSRVLLAGGCEKNLGIGQSFEVEMYDGRSHSFTGFGCLVEKRTMSTGARMADGSVLIAGNWYHNGDSSSIERFDGKRGFSFVKHASQQRRRPYVLPVSKTDALIFGSYGSRGQQFDTIWVDRLQGPSFRVPLLEQYRPLNTEEEPCCNDFAISEDTYLIPGFDQQNVMALILVRDTTFQLLPTSTQIPMQSQGEHIFYYHLMTNPLQHRAYVIGMGTDSLTHGRLTPRANGKYRRYLLEIDYSQHPAELTLYYTDPIEGSSQSTLTPNGDILLIGGTIDDNFAPSSTVWRLSPNAPSSVAADNRAGWWLWIVAVVLLAIVAIILWRRRIRQQSVNHVPQESTPNPGEHDPYAQLMQRISQLMGEEMLYLKPDLRLQDVATALNVSPRNVSDCINSQQDTSFANFVNGYRIRHAKKLMSSNPDIKVNTVWEASGFANESTFFRTFKTITSLTPKEWIQETVSLSTND